MDSTADDEKPPLQDEGLPEVSKKRKHRKPKPWDTDDIDHWKVDEFKPEHNSQPFLAESSFATLFPKYRETYLREIWPMVTAALDKVGIACVLDLVEGSITVKTTRKTYDPYVILKARDLIRLLSRSVQLNQAVKILEDGIACDIIKIGGIIRNKDRFVKRRQRLLGPKGSTLKAIELLTSCYVLVQGNTVAAMGPYKGLKDVRRLILDCMKNIHPIYHIKRNVQSSKKPTIVKKERTPFPPPQMPRKIDLQIESGEFFLSKTERDTAVREKKQEQQNANSIKKQAARLEAFVAPEEPQYKRVNPDAAPASKSQSIDELKAKFKSKAKKRKSAEIEEDKMQNYLM
ncbi:hypothetical protein BASA61_003169 [Batrachochytrium salamandrivorans]|nr:hypothetical protein BASA61_003169 [Batrachochytrium salamandrivorans]